MSSQVCVDASLVLKLVLAEADSQSAHDLWHTWIDSDTEVFAPEHLAFEATSVLRNHVYRGLISPAAGRLAFDALRAQPIALVSSRILNERTWELAEQFNRPTAYDVYYVALAEALNCDLWTADRRLVTAVHQTLPWVRWLGETQSAQPGA
ncbi:MAG: type II toxin-antitoxin system VapC family toxin [Caldilineae bacterium]|nr:type II toxin-antitoxin system VapC family toxin [Caldilineae bacterium]